MKRKERVGSLKGPAKVLKSWTDEQLSAFLENTPANLAITAPTTADLAPPSVPSHSTHESGRSGSSDGPVKDSLSKQATLSSISTLEPLEDMSFLHADEDENFEVDWLLELPESPDGYLSTLEGISSIPLVDRHESPLALGLMDGSMDDSTEHDLATPVPKSLDLDLDSVTDLDLVPYLSLTEDRDGINESEFSLLKNIRTGTSMQQLIPASEFALLDFGDPTSPGFDRRVQVKVHAALEQFVKSMESPSGQTLLQNEHLNQRQKALSELEQKLVKDIKEAYRSKSKERLQEPATSETTLKGDTGIGSSKDTEAKMDSWEEKAAVLEEDANTQEVTGLTHGATAQQDAWEEKVAVLENAVSNQAETGAGDDTTAQGNPWSEEDEKDASKGPEATFATEELELTSTANESLETEKKTTKEGGAMTSSENAQVLENSERVPDDTMQGSELEENRNLRSTIKDILSTHQSILMSLERRTMRVTKPLVTSCQELLRAMGQPVIVAADAEAESVCARLVTLGLADGTVSEDTDTAVFGNGILIRQLGGGKNKDILEINPLLAHAGLGLSRDAFRDFCILCGTDFSGVNVELANPV
ncbi:hypothetical protein EMPS_11203 [Entomortierella parvispora]|uniref:XPG-I domain-containing protein n=1 Tax=Entomortierella parvispora TaxID=205924 RepID=A0A9P3HL82_9FUNG|nr:hypothetical protein EMPS_11203 [Entomortierella parvispora]